MIALPDDVQQAARAFDEYGTINSYDAALEQKVESAFADDTYSALLSPVKKGESYKSMYTALVSYNPENFLIGDANGDKQVDILDLVRLKKYLVSMPGITIFTANVNLDDDATKITAGDLAELRKMLLKLV